MNENLSFLVIGHRGCAGVEPENTLLGVERAIEMGCPMVEVDVHLVEGELVVMHDFTVDRTTNGSGDLADMKRDYLSGLDAGKGEQVPTLLEVLDVCHERVAVNIELKGAGTADSVVELLQQREGDEVVVSGFDWGMLGRVRDLDESVPLAVLVDQKGKVDEAFDLTEKLQAMAINPSVNILSEALVQRAHSLDLMVCSFTVQTAADLKKVREAGADACFADDPRMVMGEL